MVAGAPGPEQSGLPARLGPVYTYVPWQLNTTAKMTGREAFWAHDLAWCRGAYVERNGGTNAMQFATVPPLLVELDPVPPARSGVFLTRLTEDE